jgi:hypothetical protein
LTDDPRLVMTSSGERQWSAFSIECEREPDYT